MPPTRALAVLVLLVFGAAAAPAPAAGEGPPDAAAARVVRAARAASGATGTPPEGALPVPRVVFAASGEDNANALLARPDADGDGVPELVVGWDLGQQGDNLETWSGAGFGDGDLVWGLTTDDGISGGAFPGDHGLVAFVDVTGDGVDELIAHTGWGGRSATVYDGADGTVLQSFDTYLGQESGWVYDAVVCGDVDGGGSVDFAIAVGSMADAVYMVDGASTGVHHDELWAFAAPDVVYALDVIGDLDGDGVTDLVAGTGDTSSLVFALSGATGVVLWQRDVGGTAWHLSALEDLDADGVCEVVVGTWGAGSVRLLAGATGAPIWQSGVVGANAMRVVPADDVDGDGVPDVAVSSWDTAGHLLSGATGQGLWSLPTGALTWAGDAVPDVTGDGLREVAFGDFEGLTRLADGATGAPLWAHATGGHKVLSLRGAPDVDGDGHGEVLVGAQQLDFGVEDTLVFVLSADSGVPGAGPELLLGGSAALGGTLELDLVAATPGLTSLWLAGIAPALVPVGDKGVLAIDAGALVTLLAAPVPPSGELALAGTVPDDPALAGLDVYLQVFTLGATGGSSNRVGATLGR